MDKDNVGICKKKLDEGYTIIFIDESGYSLQPFISKTWAIKGHTPVIRHSGSSWSKLSVISGIAIRKENGMIKTNLFFRIYPGQTISSTEVISFLRQLYNQIVGDIIVIWDNLNTHKSKKVKHYLQKIKRIERIQLPSYSPDMNPDEGVWNWTKTKDLVNRCSRNAKELINNVRASLKRLQKKPNILRWCLNESILEF